MKDSELISYDDNGWDEGVVQLLFNEEEANEIFRTPLVNTEVDDEIIWHYSNKGVYTVKSGYELVRSTSLDSVYMVVGEWKKIWKLSVLAKVKLFLWRALHKVMSMKVNMLVRGLGVSDDCVLCGREHDNTLHVLINCDFTKQCCLKVPLIRLFRDMMPLIVCFFAVCSMEYMEMKTGIVMVMWQIWKERNEKLWNSKPPKPTTVLSRASIARVERIEVQTVSGTWRSGGRNKVCGGWHNLEIGWSRCGVDATFFESQNCTGVGIIWQNFRGDFLEAKTITFPSCTRVAEGETMGLHEALSWIEEKGAGCVEVVTDSKLVAVAMNSNRSR